MHHDMKIFHVVWGLGLGGIETMVVNIANCQSRRGHDVHLVVVNDVVDPGLRSRLEPAVRLHAMRRRVGSRSPLPLLRLNALVLAARPHVVHFHHVRLPRLVWPPLLRKWCVTYHSVYNPAEEAFYDRAPRLFSISRLVEQELAAHRHPSVMVYNGIKVDEFAHRTGTARPHGTPFSIVQVGRLDTRHKGQDLTIEAVARVLAQGYDVSLDIIGQGPDRDKLERLIAARGLQDKVHMLGAKPQGHLQAHLCEYDLLVHPSRFEGFGLVMVEAMAAKVPVLVSDVPAQLEVISHGRYGAAFASGDADQFARQIIAAITAPDRDKTEQAYRHAATTFNVATTADNYLAQYSTL